MNAPATPPAGSAAPCSLEAHEPDPALTELAHARSASHGDTRPTSKNLRDRSLGLAVLALDPDGQPASAARQNGPATPSETCTPDTARTSIPGASIPAARSAALQRLLARYLAITSALAGQPSASASHSHTPAPPAGSDPLAPCHIADSYLEQILFFRHFSRSEIAAVRDGLRVVSAPRGTRIDPRCALWIVLRGAVQTSVCQGTSSRRVRVAGPGRCVGHLSLIDRKTPQREPVLEVELRERAVLLEIPVERAGSLLDDTARAARRFAQAFNEDAANALHDADAPLAPPSPRPQTAVLGQQVLPGGPPDALRLRRYFASASSESTQARASAG